MAGGDRPAGAPRDGHVAVLTAEGLDGVEANVLAAAVGSGTAQWLRESRGWSQEEWDAAVAALTERGLLANGDPTEEGRALKARIEQRTDELAAPPYDVLESPRSVYEALVPAARAVSKELPFPNPIGVPPVESS